MDQPTLDFYNAHAEEQASNYNAIESPLKSLYTELFQKGDSVLDVGCGSGRDMDLMLQLGFQATWLEPSEALISQACERFPHLKPLILSGTLSALPEDLQGSFDGVILSAVIMHIPEDELWTTAGAIKSLLRPGGTVVISHCTRRDGHLKDQRDDRGRLFILRSSEEIQSMFEDLGFERKRLLLDEDCLGRKGIEWETVVMERRE